MLLGCEYKLYFSEKEIRDMLKELINFGCKKAVITGIIYPEDKIGAACYDKLEDKFSFYFKPRVSGNFHGTGDIFASVFTGAVTLGKSIREALEISVGFTVDCIVETLPFIDEMWYGTCFEPCLGKLIDYIK